MKRLFYLIVILFCFLFIDNVKAEEINVDINSSNAVVYDVTDDFMLYDKKSNERIKIASLTKIMTAIIAIEKINSFDDKVIISENDYKNVYSENLTVVGFEIGEEVTYRDLLYGLLFKSGADCAYAITNNIAGSEENFVKLMNDKAQELNLKNTKFTNSVGYDEDNYSSVYDTMLFFKYALENDTFKEFISKDSYTTTNGKYTLQNVVTELVDRVGINDEYTQYILGGKSGYTNGAKNCLASYAIYNGTTYIVVTANAKSYYQIKDTVALYKDTFNKYKRQQIIDENDYLISIPSYTNKEVNIYASKPVDVLLPKTANQKDVTFDYKGKEIKKNNKDNDVLGKLNFTYDGEIIKTIDVVYDSNMIKSLNYKKIITSSKKNTFNVKKMLLITLESVGGIIIIFISMIFISMYIDVKKNKRKWKI